MQSEFKSTVILKFHENDTPLRFEVCALVGKMDNNKVHGIV